MARIITLDRLCEQMMFVKSGGRVMLPEIELHNLEGKSFIHEVVCSEVREHVVKCFVSSVGDNTIHAHIVPAEKKFFHYMVCRARSHKLKNENHTKWIQIGNLLTETKAGMGKVDKERFFEALRNITKLLHIPDLDRLLQTISMQTK